MNKVYWLVTGAALVGLGSGLGVGYLLAERHLDEFYAKLSQDEIAEAKKFYATLHKRGSFETPEQAVEALIPVEEAADALLAYQGKVEVTEVETTTVTRNIFEEMTKVDQTVPHIISEEQFMENGTEYLQHSLTYYEGDSVLVDERDEPIAASEIDKTVGVSNLNSFGSETTIYVRNNKMQTEFEIVKSEGRYSEEVLGFRGD